RILDRSLATPSLIAHVANEKFGFGMPLNRQEERFTAIGLPLDRSTMSRWLEETGSIAGATIVEAMRKEALATAFCIATDATAIPTQDVVAREALARIMIMFRLERAWKNKLPDVRKTLRDRHLRAQLDAFFEFVEPAYEQVKNQRGMLRSALGYSVRQKEAL